MKNESLVQAVRAASDYLGGETDIEDIRLYLTKTAPHVLNGRRIVNAQLRMIAQALRQQDQSGLGFAYSIAPGRFRQRSMFNADHYISVAGGLISQSRKDVRQAEKLIAEAQERGYDVSMDDADRWADDHWNDPDSDDE